MAASWKEAKESAERVGLSHVYHDCDNGTYGACREGEMQGSFKKGVFIEHRCICMPSHLSADEMGEKERRFRLENPDWQIPKKDDTKRHCYSFFRISCRNRWKIS